MSAASSPRGPLRRALDEGRTAYGISCMLGDAQIAEEVAAAGLDYVYLDGQHGVGSEAEILAMLRSIDRDRTTPLVRVARNDPGLIGRALDAGAEGVIVPMVESPEEAALAVRACRYQPEGVRSWGPLRAVRGLGVDPEAVNREVVCLVMIETRAALRAVDAIVATPGVDGVYIGPADLAVSLGGAPTSLRELAPDGELWSSIADIRRACDAAGGVCAISGDPRSASSAGFGMLTVGSDIAFIRTGIAESLAAIRDARTTTTTGEDDHV